MAAEWAEALTQYVTIKHVLYCRIYQTTMAIFYCTDVALNLKNKTSVPVFYRGNKTWIRVRERMHKITSAPAYK